MKPRLSVASAPAHVGFNIHVAIFNKDLSEGTKNRKALRLRATMKMHDDGARFIALSGPANKHGNFCSISRGVMFELRFRKGQGIDFGSARQNPLSEFACLPVVDK